MLAICFDGGLQRLPMPLGVGFGVFELHSDIPVDPIGNGRHFGAGGLNVRPELFRLAGDPSIGVFTATFDPGFKSTQLVINLIEIAFGALDEFFCIQGSVSLSCRHSGGCGLAMKERCQRGEHSVSESP